MKPCRPVLLTHYDPIWSEKFNKEKQNLLSAAGKFLTRIEHIGSTAIPGMVAKPTVDILAAITSLQEAKTLIKVASSIGYIYVPEFENELPERRYFYKDSADEDAFHLHVVELDSPFWKRHIAFRNYLRTHPDEADAYAELKIKLANEHTTDRNAYTDGKSEFIHRIEMLALGKSTI